MTLPSCIIFKPPLSTSFAPWPGQWGLILNRDHKRGWQTETETHTAHISHRHLHISVHNTHTFLFNHMTASSYFHRCVLCRESLIDGSVKGQHASWPLQCIKDYFIQIYPSIILLINKYTSNSSLLFLLNQKYQDFIIFNWTFIIIDIHL